MAIIQCPECGNNVSNSAKNCPNCGYPIAENTNDLIRIKIEQSPVVRGEIVTIKDMVSGKKLCSVPAGSIAEIKSNKPIMIGFYGLTNIPMCMETVSPANGGKYKASWGAGIFSPKISSCSKVDIIDS